MSLSRVMAAWTHSLLASLAQHPTFFDATPSARQAALATSDLPQALRAYACTVEATAFLQNMRQATPHLASPRLPKDLRSNAFWRACAESLCETIALYDQDPDLLEELQPFVRAHTSRHFAFVQTPVLLEAKDRAHMREALQTHDAQAVPLFRVESSLGGGFRLFHQGTLVDRSWTGTAKHLLGRLFAH